MIVGPNASSYSLDWRARCPQTIGVWPIEVCPDAIGSPLVACFRPKADIKARKRNPSSRFRLAYSQHHAC